ncbi:MAG: hypothetical protein Q9160_009082 [Pyrenula sp. 1 TL-2023]
MTERSNSCKAWTLQQHQTNIYLKASDKTESKLDEFLKPLREAEVKAFEKALDSVLEKSLANVAVLLGICLATALAPWTSIQTSNATGVQIGSYALLLSISTGLLALVSGITHLTNATEMGRKIHLLQEKTIEAGLEFHENNDAAQNFSFLKAPKFGLSRGIPGQSRITSHSLWRSTSLLGKLPCLLFGSALMLIPHSHRDRQTFTDESRALYFKVDNTTLGYFVHKDNSDGRIFHYVPNLSPSRVEELGNFQAKIQARSGKDG